MERAAARHAGATSMTPTPPPLVPEAAAPRRWHPLTRFAFRFACIHFTLFSLAGIIGLIPILGQMLGYQFGLAVERPIVVWFAKVAFGLDITIFPGGSGDTTYNWVQLALYAGLAAVGSILWSLIDWRRGAYPWLHEAFMIAMRFVLAGSMLSYGINKVFALQFPAPHMGRLLQTYGDSSPMGLLWTFMGASPAYTMFGGWMETIGGLLLLFRRTTLLGALWTAGVMTNVVLLNLCYDVPVKIYSSHLLLMAIIIVAPHARDLAGYMLLNRPMPARDLIGPWTNAPLRWTGFAIKLVWVVTMTGMMTFSLYQMQYTYGARAPRGALDGTWEAITLRRNGSDVPALVTDESRWRYLTIIDRPDWKMLSIAPMSGTTRRWQLSFLGADRTPTTEPGERGALVLVEQAAASDEGATPTPFATLAFERRGEDELSIVGTFGGEEIEVLCRRRSPEEFLLMNRGFHWINEVPFNR